MINHVEIYVSNLSTSIQFWQWLLVDRLGYTVNQKWNKGISYTIDGGGYIVFVQAEPRRTQQSYNRTNVGLNHLAFSISDKKLLEQIRAELKDLNYQELYAENYPYAGGKKHYALYFEDPDRIKVELVLIV